MNTKHDSPVHSSLQIEPRREEPGAVDSLSANADFNSEKSISLTRDALRRLRKNRMAMMALLVLLLYMLVSFSANWLPIYSYKFQILDHKNLPPSLTKTAGQLWYERELKLAQRLAARQERDLNDAEQKKLAAIEYKIEHDRMEINGEMLNPHLRHYWLGTDALGRDVLSRTIYGGRISISIGLIGALTAVLIGIVVGAVAGFYGGRIDYMLMRFVDVLYGLPYMLLVVVLMAVLGKSILNLYIALALISWLTVARVVRGQILSLKHAEFVEAARTMGASTARIIIKHMIPNTLGVIIVFTTLRIPAFIMAEAFLSFLGLGVSAPLASWGSLIGVAVPALETYSWQLFVPSLAMIVFLFAMNFLGDGLRDAFDPKGKVKN